jgi:large subunit ribosomal protein L6
MSRVASRPIDLPNGVTVTVAGDAVTVKGAKGSLSLPVPKGISVVQENKQLAVKYQGNNQARDQAKMSAGSTRAHLANMVEGVSKGYERKLELVGVGYRAAVQGKALNLTLGFSHPVAYPIPDGISIETPSQTEIIIKGVDTQRVGQIAAEIREFRPPEPYKGKGVKYSDEKIALKEGKKK